MTDPVKVVIFAAFIAPVVFPSRLMRRAASMVKSEIFTASFPRPVIVPAKPAV